MRYAVRFAIAKRAAFRLNRDRVGPDKRRNIGDVGVRSVFVYPHNSRRVVRQPASAPASLYERVHYALDPSEIGDAEAISKTIDESGQPIRIRLSCAVR